MLIRSRCPEAPSTLDRQPVGAATRLRVPKVHARLRDAPGLSQSQPRRVPRTAEGPQHQPAHVHSRDQAHRYNHELRSALRRP